MASSAAAGGMMGTAPQKAPRYRAFLLRCWQERSSRLGQPGTWRFQLQDVDTGEKRSFADLKALAAFLREDFDAEGAGDRRQA